MNISYRYFSLAHIATLQLYIYLYLHISIIQAEHSTKLTFLFKFQHYTVITMIEILNQTSNLTLQDNDISPNTSTLPSRSPQHNPLRILKFARSDNNRPAFIAGPMVRYSKLPFRELVRNFNTDIVYTPMILAREFVRNDIARLSDFTTNAEDRSVIVQVGCNNVKDLLKFVDMIHPYVDGIGLNCGCPIKEQVREGIGAALMSEPELVSQMVKAVKDKYKDSVVIETKIRIHPDINETIKFVKLVEKMEWTL